MGLKKIQRIIMILANIAIGLIGTTMVSHI